MAGLLYAGFDYGTTATLSDLWNSVSAVVLDPTGGRAGGGCLLFDATLGSELVSKPLTWTIPVSEQARAVVGFAFKPIHFPAQSPVQNQIKLLTLTSTSHTYDLYAFPNGALELRQDGTIQSGPQGGPHLFSDNHGVYMELRLQVQFPRGVVASIRVNQLTVATGECDAAGVNGETFTGVTFGGPFVVNQTATWALDDVYVLDSTPAASFIFGSRRIDNADYLGNVIVKALLATQDGGHATGIHPGYTPWDTTPVTVDGPYFDKVNENPADDGATDVQTDTPGTYDAGAHSLDVYATFQFTIPYQSPHFPGFGIKWSSGPGGAYAPWELFALQWIPNSAGSGGASVAGTVRVVASTAQLPSDANAVVLTDDITPDSGYSYQVVIMDRSIAEVISFVEEWTFNDVFLQPGLFSSVGFTEFGMTLRP